MPFATSKLVKNLTVWYISDVARMIRAERQELLRKVWRFDCCCECCMFTGSQKNLSDKRRAKIKEIDDSVLLCERSNEMVKTLKMAVEYADAEGIRGTGKTRICYDGFQIALGARNLGEAKKFIKMCLIEFDRYG